MATDKELVDGIRKHTRPIPPGRFMDTDPPRTPSKDAKRLTHEFKTRKRKDLINGMQVTIYSMTDAELDKALRKAVEEAIEKVIKEHKDSQALAYTITKE